ncbi:DUF3520 domain-containing protein [Flavobacterium zepuense]|uniref:DUF3520 domain-containing protein n=2 Tax=Flavobacterium zepuense TaxID=2593302 RepID=A0A552UYR4_9FLAO|nr:DUF3520 domain-containing protein [Flavobacterium zepuense]
MFITKTRAAMENNDKIYDQFKDAASKAETKDFARMEAVWSRVEDKLDNKKQRKIVIWWKYTGIAALLLLFIGIGFIMLNNNNVVKPDVAPQNNVTVIDTQAVKETFNPEKVTVKEEVVVEEMPNNTKGRKEYVVTSKNKKATKQPIVFNGTIVDDSGMPVPGVSILVNGKSAAVLTDFDGKFTVNAHVGDNITTDYTGMVSAIFKATSETNNTTVAINSGSELSEVVVEGYRTTTRSKSNVAVTTVSSSVIEKQSRRERRKGERDAKIAVGMNYELETASPTGNANVASAPNGYSRQDNRNYRDGDRQSTVVSSETIEGRPNASFVQSLQGQVPGLNVTTGSGAPGSQSLQGRVAGVAITPNAGVQYDTLSDGRTFNRALPNGVAIRGVASIQSNFPEPLYVIDGKPVSARVARKLDAVNIESIEVLKDAGATAVYGSKAVYGVVVIKTKKLTRKQQRELKKALKEDEKAGYIDNATGKFVPMEKIKIDHEEYEAFEENKFENPATTPLSTFSIDVDNASYTNIRRFLNNAEVVPKDAVRVEEMINFFKYNYPQPLGADPFSINTEYSNAPWNPNHKLLKIGLQGKEIQSAELPASNFVFLIDVSGSMSDVNKLPLLKQSMKLLVNQMRKQDRIAIVVYAGAAGLVLPGTSGDQKAKIIAALDNLNAGGSTAGGAGIELAYKTALENFVKKGNNRVILATDGDFNVGASSNTDMQTLIEEKRKSGVFLTCLGYGMGNYKDSKLETLADKGNGNYAYVDNMQEADRYLNKEFKGSMYAIAKDVKIQIEFNPKYVQSYRLIGYENRKLRDEDFANDAIDAGELGSGHTVTALYEIIPTGVKSDYFNAAPELKYSTPQTATGNYNDELATIKFRSKKPDEDVSKEIVKVIPNISLPIQNTSVDFKFSAAVAWFGLKLRDSKLVPDKSIEAIKNLAKQGLQNDPEGYRAEFIRLVNMVE